jgi:co-chaperonin GroES (HSP10)
MTDATSNTDEMSNEQRAKTIPAPSGWKVLCALPEVDTTFEGTSIVKAETFMRQEEHASTVLFVVKLGPDAYKDAAKFPAGPWCKEGDFVIVRTYSGTRLKIFGREFRLLNDDQIEAVVEDPRGISRA